MRHQGHGLKRRCAGTNSWARVREQGNNNIPGAAAHLDMLPKPLTEDIQGLGIKDYPLCAGRQKHTWCSSASRHAAQAAYGGHLGFRDQGLSPVRRATTTYLVQRRIDMLPKPLTEDICSLRSGVERLAFSVLWEMTPDAVPVNVRFTKSVIRHAAAGSAVREICAIVRHTCSAFCCIRVIGDPQTCIHPVHEAWRKQLYACQTCKVVHQCFLEANSWRA